MRSLRRFIAAIEPWYDWGKNATIRALIHSGDPHKMAAGFFLFGVSEAARGGKIGD